MWVLAVLVSAASWFAGLVLDANIKLGEPLGFTNFRILFPILVMGAFIIHAIEKKDR